MLVHYLFRIWRKIKYLFFIFTIPLIVFGQAKTYDGVKFPLGDLSFADKVIDYRITKENRTVECSNPNNVLGIPDRKEKGESSHLAIGNAKTPCESYVTVEFVDNYLVDGDGIDLWVFEVGNNSGGINEPIEVYISNDLKNWIFVGRSGGGKEGIDISDKVLPNQRFKYVRVCDEAGKNTTSGKTPGPDIDAIGAIGSVYRPMDERDDPLPGPSPTQGLIDNCGPPSLAGHHSWIDLSREDCIARAQNAMRSAGFNILGVDNGYVIGKTEQHSSFIRCICTISGIKPDEETLMAVTVATPDNWPGGSEPIRDYLRDFMQNPGEAGTPPDLSATPPTINNGGFTPAYSPPNNPNTSAAADCSNPRLLQIMDEWLLQAKPIQKSGESLRFEPWGRVVGISNSSVITVNGPPTTHLTRCEWLWQYAGEMESQNLGTLRNFVLSKL